jgi:hypothetical protein
MLTSGTTAPVGSQIGDSDRLLKVVQQDTQCKGRGSESLGWRCVLGLRKSSKYQYYNVFTQVSVINVPGHPDPDWDSPENIDFHRKVPDPQFDSPA